jgi:hypothetical protein
MHQLGDWDWDHLDGYDHFSDATADITVTIVDESPISAIYRVILYIHLQLIL